MPVARFDVLTDHNTTPRERILHALLCGISSRACIYNSEEEEKVVSGSIGAFPGLGYKGIEVGDMVMGGCGAVGTVVVKGEHSNGWAILIAGTSQIQTWDNESFHKFIGIYKPDILPEEEFQFYRHARKTICAHDNAYWQRFNVVRFEGGDAAITFYKRWENDTRDVTIPNWRRWVKLKRPPSLIKLLIAEGWGSESFFSPKQTAEPEGEQNQ